MSGERGRGRLMKAGLDLSSGRSIAVTDAESLGFGLGSMSTSDVSSTDAPFRAEAAFPLRSTNPVADSESAPSLTFRGRVREVSPLVLERFRLWQALKSFHCVLRSSEEHGARVVCVRLTVASNFAVLLPGEFVHLFMPHSLLLNVAIDVDAYDVKSGNKLKWSSGSLPSDRA